MKKNIFFKAIYMILIISTILIFYTSFNYQRNYNFYNMIEYKDFNISEEYINETSISESITKIIFNDSIVKLKNPIFIKDDVIFVELKDISKILDLNFICKQYDIYEYQESGMFMSVLLEKYELSLEVFVNKTYSLKNIPGSINYFPLSSSPFIKNKNLIYIPLLDITQFFHCNIDYNKKDNIIKIYNYDDRKSLSWQKIYENAINDYINFSEFKQEICKNGLNDNMKNYEPIYFGMSHGGRYSFSLHDFTNDRIPELLLETSDLFYLSYPGSTGMICYKLNPKTKLLEEICRECVGYDNKNRLYQYKHEQGGYGSTEEIAIVNYKCIIWDNEKEFIDFEIDLNSQIYNKYIKSIQEFKTYGGTSLISKKIDVKSIIDSYSNLPESIYIDDVKVKVDNKDIIFTGHEPIVKSSTVYVPVKDVFEAMGYKVVWLNNGSPGILQVGKSNSGVLITKEEELYFLPSEGKMVNINRKLDVIDDYNPITIEETFMIPYYWIEKLTGVEVIWENPSIGKLNTVYINLK